MYNNLIQKVKDNMPEFMSDLIKAEKYPVYPSEIFLKSNVILFKFILRYN